MCFELNGNSKIEEKERNYLQVLNSRTRTQRAKDLGIMVVRKSKARRLGVALVPVFSAAVALCAVGTGRGGMNANTN